MFRLLTIALVPWRITTVAVWALTSATLLTIQEVENTIKDALHV